MGGLQEWINKDPRKAAETIASHLGFMSEFDLEELARKLSSYPTELAEIRGLADLSRLKDCFDRYSQS